MIRLGTEAETPADKGPIVWLDMDQTQLDAAYDQSIHAPNAEHVAARREESSRRALARLGPPVRWPYGSAPIEGLDFYRARTGASPAPMFVFVHGGAWRNGRSAQAAYMAETFVNAGAHFLALDFANVTETDGDLRPMRDQIRRALIWIAQNAEHLGGDAAQLYLCGHSSGGHLAACAVATEWERFGAPPNLIRAALLSSGMYDLRPVRLSKRSAYVRFTDDVVEDMSAIRRIDRIRAPVVLTHGSLESPEFIRQARAFFDALESAGKPAALRVGVGYNHFEIQETLGNPYGFLGHAALEMMGLA